ncbi:MAG: helix-turn-helix domain-containing protein [Parcubacteria group bacterium]
MACDIVYQKHPKIPEFTSGYQQISTKILQKLNPRAILIGTIMKNDKLKALKLRMKGRSYNEINKLLGIPKSTLSTWFSGLDIPDKAVKRLEQRVYKKSIEKLIARNKRQTHLAEQRARSIQNEAKKNIKPLLSKDLMLIGIALYWAEGYKRPIIRNGRARTHHPVSFTNSDPQMIKLFLRFLRNTCAVPEDKITGDIRIYEHQNENYLMDFWSKATDIPYSRLKKFHYGISKSSKNRRPFNILPYGTIQIRVNSTPLYHKIMGWIEGLKNL